MKKKNELLFKVSLYMDQGVPNSDEQVLQNKDTAKLKIPTSGSLGE